MSFIKKVGKSFNNLLSSPAGGFLDAFIGTNFYGSGQQSKQNERAFQMQRQLINEQNLYNSPYNQMLRYSEAGLNPNLVYGQINSGNQSNIASPSAYSAGNNRLLSSIGRNLRNIYYQNANLDLQNKRLANENVRLANEEKRLDNDARRLDLLDGVQSYKVENMKMQNALNAMNLRKKEKFFNSSVLMNAWDSAGNLVDYINSPSGASRVLSFIKKYLLFNKI